MSEEWRAVVGYEGYEVSDQGRVRSIDRTVVCSDGRVRPIRGRVLKLNRSGRGYLCVSLGARNRYRRVHALVLETFISPRPEGAYACHANDVRTDNRLSNLRWATPSENNLDAVRNGHNFWALKTECPRHHPYSPENTRVANGRRFCRACKGERDRARRAARTLPTDAA